MLPPRSQTWERLIERSPERAYLTFSRLEGAYPHVGDTRRFPELCRSLIAGFPQDWRARLALARHLDGQGQPREALDLLFDALVQNPHALSVHQAIWQMLSRLQLPTALVDQYVDLTRGAIFYARPAHLRALPLSQHRAALAVPELPRMEHVRRRAHRTRQGHGSDVSSSDCP